MENPLTPEGEIILKAFEVHRLHLESHRCKQCLNSYETVLNAVTAWVKSESKMEVKDDKDTVLQQEETPKEAGKGQSVQAEKPSKKKDPLAIFR